MAKSFVVRSGSKGQQAISEAEDTKSNSVGRAIDSRLQSAISRIDQSLNSGESSPSLRRHTQNSQMSYAIDGLKFDRR